MTGLEQGNNAVLARQWYKTVVISMSIDPPPPLAHDVRNELLLDIFKVATFKKGNHSNQ